ncbi:MAG: hypothetical protein KBC57_00165 [Neisseriaceae bacterium]|nr:hypothetical protein [Neisseriaceae bacterium]MBP6860753.1 hypothetical protein [Neisseriaceae bacterium]
MNLLKQFKIVIALLGLAAMPIVWAQTAYPQDVQALIQRADGCGRVIEAMSEVKSDNAESAEQKLADACRGLDQQIAEVKEQYQNNPEVIEKIADYDELFQMVHWLQVGGLI